jgi:D-sedoheptulose 7-phosphate isomerase
VNVILECQKALEDIDQAQLDATVDALRDARRVFCVGNGGGYAHAMHFVSDLRKIAHKQAFSFDNLAELTARVNDDGWERAWADWLFAYGYKGGKDVTFLFSVGGRSDALSANLPQSWLGIVGERGAYGDRIVIPSTSTPVVEGCQSVIMHHLIEQLCG